MRSLPAVPIFALLIYAGAMIGYIYGFEHRPDADYAREIGPDEVLVLAAIAMLHLALGAVVGRWPVVLAPALSVLLAIPAGDYPGGWPETSVAAAVTYQTLFFGVPLVVLGVVLRSVLVAASARRAQPYQPQ